VPVNRGGRILTDQRLTGQAIRAILARRAAKANVAALSPHDLRRTFVGDALDRGADLAVLSKLAGHASPTTTARYDRRPEAAKRKAADLLHIPYRPAPTAPDHEAG
jgi:site-specific recombinase XerD